MLKRAYLRVSDPDTDPTPTILNVLENFKEMPYNQSIKKKKQPTTTGITLSEHSTVFFVHVKVQEVGKVLIIYRFFKFFFLAKSGSETKKSGYGFTKILANLQNFLYLYGTGTWCLKFFFIWNRNQSRINLSTPQH